MTNPSPPVPGLAPQRVFVLGATGTIGQATVKALSDAGHRVVCMVRPAWSRAGAGGESEGAAATVDLRARMAQWPGVELRLGDPLSGESLRRDGLRGERFDVWVTCMASRTGAPADAWAVDHAAHVTALQACREAGVGHVVMLSAICVQKPLLAFQAAKLAFEQVLIESGLNYSIVRPTAFFKSLSGQVDRLRRGRPFLLFGDGALTACKPISDEDLGAFMARCLQDSACHRAILPIGGPGPALTPRQQGLLLFEALGLPPKFRSVPVGLMDAIVGMLNLLGHLSPKARAKAELARIGRYYATESMLVWDGPHQRYDAQATPEFGTRTLADHYRALARGEIADQRGDHAVF